MEPEAVGVGATRRRLVFLHGFTQTHHHWHRPAFALARRLAGGATLVLPDMPGHGLSADDRRPIHEAALAVAELCGSGTYVGYSMGGRYALLAACARAPQIERLVVIGASPGIGSEAERSERRAADAARADELERAGLPAFLDDWMAMPMFATLPDEPDDREHRLRNTSAGLAASLRSSGTGSQPDLWPQLSLIAVPVLVIAGAFDEKFGEIGRQMAAAIPSGSFAAIDGAGHAAHLEQPEATATVIAGWLAAL